jgi:putative DNA-invertase from lambdoid prophage Rac
VKVVIYARVSTDRQVHDSQLQEVKRYCERREWHNVEEVVDTASGAKHNRTGLDGLMAAVRRGKVDVIVCFKLDRLGRSLAHLAQLIAEFQTHGVSLVCTSQGIDTTNQNPAADLQLHILCAVAQFEREVIRDRVNAGLAAARKRGVKLGRPKTLDRYRNAVALLVAQGKGVCAIARELGLPLSSTSKVVKALRSESVS